VSRSNSTDCDGIPLRFHQGEHVPSTDKLVGEKMDNAPPWDFMRPAQELYDASFPADCVAVAASRPDDEDAFPLVDVAGTDPDFAAYLLGSDENGEHYDRFDALFSCVNLWGTEKTAGSGVFYPEEELFTTELGTSPRLAFIAQVYEDHLDSQTTYVHIEGFVPSFMYRMYTSSVTTMCDPADGRATKYGVHDAGQQLSCAEAKGQAKVDRLASLILACGMVTDDLCNKDTDLPVSAGLDIHEFRLTK
jgi:hypothetical protein